MGTTAEKIEYLNETKELIKQSLNDLGADIEDSNNFRSYVQKINTLYEDWPKITDEGTFLSLNSTQKGKMKIELKGNTLQDGEPTPTNPVDINVVSGSNVIYTNNKNFIQLSNFTTTVNGMTIKFENDKIILNGTTTSNTDILLTNLNWNSFSTEMLSKINKYNEKICASNNSSLVTYFVTNQGEYLTQSITLSNAVKLVSIFIRIPSGKTYNNKDIEAQIEISSNPTTYKIHQGKELPLDLGSIELCKIGGYQDYFYKSGSKWYLHKEIGKTIINGSEAGWNSPSDNRFNLDNLNIKFKKQAGAILHICNKYKAYNQTESNGNFNNLVQNVDYGFNLSTYTPSSGIAYNARFKDTRFTNITDFKTWLASNNIILYCVLETATDTEITDTTLISQLEAIYNATSYKEQTNILQENDNLPFILNVSALQKE